MSEDNWKHRSSKMSCGTCMFFVEKLTLAVQKPYRLIGRCRFNAPTMKGWPVLFSSDWCGQHKLDENKLSKSGSNEYKDISPIENN